MYKVLNNNYTNLKKETEKTPVDVHQLKNQLNVVKVKIEENIKCVINRNIELERLQSSSERSMRTSEAFNERSDHVKKRSNKITILKIILVTIIFSIIIIVGLIILPNAKDLQSKFLEILSTKSEPQSSLIVMKNFTTNYEVINKKKWFK
jgi:hypothetical protein